MKRFPGRALPKSAQRAAEIWRPWIEERVGPHLGKLPELLHDQKAYAAEVHRLLTELDMGAPGENQPEDGEAEEKESSAGMDQDEKQESSVRSRKRRRRAGNRQGRVGSEGRRQRRRGRTAANAAGSR